MTPHFPPAGKCRRKLGDPALRSLRSLPPLHARGLSSTHFPSNAVHPRAAGRLFVAGTVFPSPGIPKNVVGLSTQLMDSLGRAAIGCPAVIAPVRPLTKVPALARTHPVSFARCVVVGTREGGALPFHLTDSLRCTQADGQEGGPRVSIVDCAELTLRLARVETGAEVRHGKNWVRCLKKRRSDTPRNAHEPV